MRAAPVRGNDPVTATPGTPASDYGHDLSVNGGVPVRWRTGDTLATGDRQLDDLAASRAARQDNHLPAAVADPPTLRSTPSPWTAASRAVWSQTTCATAASAYGKAHPAETRGHIMSDLDLSEAIDAASNATEHVQGALVIAVTAAASVIERQVREHIAADLMAQIGEYNPVGDSFFRLAAIIARDGRNLARGDGS